MMQKMEEQVSNTSKVIKGMSSQTLVTIVNGVVEVGSFSIMSRLLSQQDFGYYAAISAITIVFASFSETGIGSAIIQRKEINSKYINNAFTISFIFGLFISLLLLVLAYPLSLAVADSSMTVPLMLMSVTLISNCMTSVNTSIMHRRLEFLRVGMIRLVSLVVTTIVAIILALKGYGYYSILTKAILTSLITLGLSWVMAKTRYRFELDLTTFKSIFRFSGWLMASVLFRNLAHQVETLMMPRLLSVTALGAYNRPKGFVDQISDKLNGIFDTALFPVLSGIQDDKYALGSAFHRSLSVLNVYSLLLTLGIMFNSDLIIRVFFGTQWLNLRTVMFAIAGTLLFNIDGRLADCFLRSLAMTRQQFYFRIFETVVRLLSVLIGYRWGILGVAVSVMIANAITKIVKVLYIGVKIGEKPLGVVGLLFSSWRFGLLLIPICTLAYFLLPKNWGGDLVMAAVFCVLSIIIFLFMPRFVGKSYYDEVYLKVRSFIIQRIRIRLR